jgi:hypothetical protein
MRPCFNDVAVNHSDDDVAVADRREPMSNDEDGSVAHDLAHVVLDDTLAFVALQSERVAA